MAQQKTLDFGKRERRERLIATLRELGDSYVRNCVGLPPHLKRMLLALHARCINKPYCWPSLRTLADDLGYSTDPADWPAVKRTMIRHTQALKGLGLLIIAPRFDRHDSQTSNAYRIKYQTLKRDWQKERTGNADTVPGRAPKGRCQVPSDPGGTSGRVPVSPGGCHQCHRGGVISVTGGVSSVSPRELNLNVTRTEAEVLAAKPQIRTAASGGGFGSYPEFPDNCRKPRGSWTGLITRDLLRQPSEVTTLFNDAVKAGLIIDNQVNRIRIVALARQCVSEANIGSIGGLVVQRIEAGAWNYLHPEKVREAARLLGVTLTPEQLATIRTAGSAKPVNAGKEQGT